MKSEGDEPVLVRDGVFLRVREVLSTEDSKGGLHREVSHLHHVTEGVERNEGRKEEVSEEVSGRWERERSGGGREGNASRATRAKEEGRGKEGTNGLGSGSESFIQVL